MFVFRDVTALQVWAAESPEMWLERRCVLAPKLGSFGLFLRG